jgi:hypothetical protein
MGVAQNMPLLVVRIALRASRLASCRTKRVGVKQAYDCRADSARSRTEFFPNDAGIVDDTPYEP